MIIADMAVRKRTSVIVLAIVIIIFGLVAYNSLPRESSPDITIPYVFVTTTYEGVAPADMEELITIPIERKLKGIDHVAVAASIVKVIVAVVAKRAVPALGQEGQIPLVHVLIAVHVGPKGAAALG